MSLLLLLSAALIVVGAAGVLLLNAPSALLISLGVAAAVFAGNSSSLGFPIPPDRLLMAAGLFLLLVGTERRHLPISLRFRSQHALMLVFGTYAILNALVAGTLTGQGGYGLLDRLSITGWLLFSVAPIVFHDHRTRNIFLGVMVGLGAYLGLIAILEGIGLRGVVFPRYIDDPNVGIHFDRARGPMVEAAGFGLALFECAVMGALASRVWVKPAARWFALAVTAACLLGTLFTLTRAVWLGVAAGAFVVCLISREWRRRLLPPLIAASVILLVVLASSSSLSGKVNERSTDQRPVWDRLNLADAGIRAIEENPAFGVGWLKFTEAGPDYFRLLPDIPQTGTTIEIHNAPISYGAQLGLVGLIMWLGVVGSTIFAAMFWRPPPVLENWRVALVATGVQWAVVAMFTPFSYPFSMFFVFTLAGIVAAPRFVQPRRPLTRHPRRAPASAGDDPHVREEERAEP